MNKVGRPKIDPAELKKSRTIRATDRDWETLKVAAAMEGLGINQYLESCIGCREALKKLLKVVRAGRPSDPRDSNKWDKAVLAAESALETR